MMWSWVRSAARSVMLAGMFAEAAVELLMTRPATRLERAAWLHRFCARSLRRMGIPVTVQGRFPERGSLIVNHQSYLDIVTLASIHPCVFVSKAEVARVPVIGWMTTMSGTVYVERGRHGSAMRASTGMKAATDAGMVVVFFPEGTTNTEKELLPFHSGLLAQAMAEGEPVTASYIGYSIGADNPRDVSVAQQVAWGDVGMFAHVFRFLGLRSVHANVVFAPDPITFSADGLHRKVAAVEARDAVARLASRAVPG